MIRLVFILVIATICPPLRSNQATFWISGEILQSDGMPFRGVTPIVFLHGATTPYTTQTVANPDGRFTFKNLRPGMYNLTVAVPRSGELMKTIDVGPSTADRAGKIKLKLQMERNLASSLSSPKTVSAAELSVPDQARSEYEKAEKHLEKHEVESAVDRLKQAVEIAPQFTAAWNNLGRIAYMTGKYDEAEQYFRKALEQEPDSYPPLVNLGGVLISLRKMGDSLLINLLAVRANPADPLAHSQLGQSHFFLGQFEQAEMHLKRAKSLDPGHFTYPQIVLAEIYLIREDHASAIRELEEFLRLHPDSRLAPNVRKKLETVRAQLQPDPHLEPR